MWFQWMRTSANKDELAALEKAVKQSRKETQLAEERLRNQIDTANRDLERVPIAGALTYRGRKYGRT